MLFKVFPKDDEDASWTLFLLLDSRYWARSFEFSLLNRQVMEFSMAMGLDMFKSDREMFMLTPSSSIVTDD